MHKFRNKLDERDVDVPFILIFPPIFDRLVNVLADVQASLLVCQAKECF